MHDEYEEVGTSRGVRVVRAIAVWVALIAVVWAIWGFYGDFVRAKDTLSAQTQGSATASSTVQASVVTTVTGLVATVRTDVPLRSQPDTSTAVIATSREGSTLDVVAKQGTWLRVKDKSGHVGWVPNDTQYLVVKTKVATKSSKKK